MPGRLERDVLRRRGGDNIYGVAGDGSDGKHIVSNEGDAHSADSDRAEHHRRPQHMLAALRVFLLGRTKLHERWSDAINAWVKMEGRPPIMYPTVKESEKGVMPRIASFADDSSKCTVCRTQQACDHWYSRIMERLVGHHLDIVFPISLSVTRCRLAERC